MKAAAPPRRVVHLVRDPQALNLSAWRAAPAAGAEPKTFARRAALANGSRRLLDGLLQGVELMALVGLVWMILSALPLLRLGRAEAVQVAPSAAPAVARPPDAPQRESGGAAVAAAAQNRATAAQNRATAAQTPPFAGHSPLELPGGRLPRMDAVTSAPGLALAPLPLDASAEPEASVGADAAPAPSTPLATRLQVPAIQVDAPIVQGDGWEQLKQGVGQHLGTGAPGTPGNVVLSAHNDVYGKIFRHLNQLQIGDEILLFNGVTTFRYLVDWKKIVRPGRVDLMQPTDYPSVTLISCYPYGVDTHRIVVTARLIVNTDANP